ncbi:MAG: P-loop NTPase fold protein [Elusimicrobiota bacterium]|nr:P-loop NTPase fold protein [Elusimicrobiota bacterium]
MKGSTETRGNRCEAHILSDAPANEDAFGAHKRLADAVVALILSGLGGKAIALSGTWGSGKSTVINFIRDMLCQKRGKKESSIFVFDAWAHAGDPLRRTFIERLIAHLDTEGWIKKKDWETDLNRITRRCEETSATSSPVLTLWGKCLVCLFLLVPLGYSLFGTVAKDSVPVLYSLPIWAWGLFLVLLPLLFALLVTLVIAAPGWFSGNKTDTNAVFAFFVNKLQEVNTTKTIRTPDPTTIEFQDIFVRILNSALSTASRQLVVVVDNIDRVSPEEAVAIWATMRTLFEFDGTQSVKWRKQFWLIVPVDKSALSRLWATDANADGLVQAFIEKTFQIEFRISPPILSDWKNYFVNQLKLALPNHKDENELYDIYRLYKQKIAANHGIVTPRSVKLFINSIVTSHLQWEDRIPLQSQALFAIYSDKISDPQLNLIGNEFLDRRILNLVDGSEWRTHLAALHYNVDPKNAIQVLIGREVEEALTSGKNDDLLKYKDIPGLIEVVEHTIGANCEDWAEKEPAALALSGLCLGRAIDALPPTSSKLWKWLNKGLLKVVGWKNFSTDVGLGVVEILKHCPKDDFAATAGTALKVFSKVSHPDETLTVAINSWLKAILPVVNYLQDNGERALFKGFRIQSSAVSYVEAITLLADEDVSMEVKTLFLPNVETLTVINELAQLVSAGKLRETHIKALKLLMQLPGEWPWNTLATAIAARLNLATTLDPNEQFSCVRGLVMLAEHSGDANCQTQLEGICRNGHILHHLSRIGDDNAKAIAMSIIAMLGITPNVQGFRNTPNFQRGAANFNAFLANPESQAATLSCFVALSVELEKISSLIELATTAPNVVPLVSSALKCIVTGENPVSVLPSNLVFSHRETLRKLIGDELLAKIVNGHAKDELFASLIQKSEFSLIHTWFYLLLLKSNPTMYAAYLAAGLNTITKDVWASELDSESEGVALLLEFVSLKLPVNLRHEFGDALLEHAKRIISGNIKPSRFQDMWSQLKGNLREDSRREFVANLRDLLIEKSDQNISTVISIYGDTLNVRELLLEQSDNVVRKLFTQILERGQEIELSWLGSIKSVPDIVNACKADYKTAFLDRVRDLVKTNSYLSIQSKELLKTIARNLNITIEEIEKT